MAPNELWQQTESMMEQHSKSNNWLKLKADGDKVVVVFLGNPYPREVCFVDGKCIPYSDELKAQGLKPSLRVSMNVAIYATKEIKIIEQGVYFFKDVVRVRDKYSLEGWAYEICRHGAAKDIDTTYAILPEKELTAEQQKEFQSLPLHDFKEIYSRNGDEFSDLGSYDREKEEINTPFAKIDKESAYSLAVSLKDLPKKYIEKFCAEFGVNRVRDLPARRAKEASDFISWLNSDYIATSNQDTDINPFA